MLTLFSHYTIPISTERVHTRDAVKILSLHNELQMPLEIIYDHIQKVNKICNFHIIEEFDVPLPQMLH